MKPSFGIQLLAIVLLFEHVAVAQVETKVFARPHALADNATVTDWPAFLGKYGRPHSPESPLLKAWPDTGPTLLWTRHRGQGYASPSIAAGHLILFHRMADEEVVECLAAETGELKWKHAYTCNYRDRYGYNNGPRTTPYISGGHVFTLGVEGMLHCLNLENGEVIWKKNLADVYQLAPAFFGVGASPIVEGDLLIINIGAVDGPCVVALSIKDGQEVWRAGGDWGASYASPVAATIHGQRRILVFAGGERRPPVGGLLCINPKDGKVDFEVPWRSRTYESVNASSPVVIGDDRVFISASYDTGGAMVRITEDFNATIEWTTDKLSTHMGTTVYLDGHLYGVDGRHQQEAAIVCMKADTGEEVWRWQPTWDETYEAYGSKRTRPYEIGRGSLLCVDGRFLCVGEMGHLLWLDLSPKRHDILARHWMFAAPQTWTPPVISHGLLYIMQNETDRLNSKPARLLCYDLRGK